MQRTDGPEKRTEWLRLRHELAGLRFEQALLKAELKYRADQAREPAGQPTGGRFAGGSGSAAAHPSRGFLAPPVAAAGVAARVGASGAAALTGAEAAAALVPVGLGAIAGGVGVSRTAGLVARGPNGSGGLTPMLHLPLPSLVPNMPMSAMSGRRDQGGPYRLTEKRVEECDEALQEDDIKCQTFAALYGRTTKQRAKIAAICKSTAITRLGECRRGLEPWERSPLYDGIYTNSSSTKPKKTRKKR